MTSDVGKLIDVVHQQAELIRVLSDVGSNLREEIRDLRRRLPSAWQSDVAKAFDQADCQEALYLLATGRDRITSREYRAIRDREDYGAQVSWLLGLVEDAVEHVIDDDDDHPDADYVVLRKERVVEEAREVD